MIVVLTGAGISADSGLATFRDSDGLWANYRIEEVCTPEALLRDRKKVIDFYNMRRKEMISAQPNAAHIALVELSKHFDTKIITQNIDDLHERAGSCDVLHLHGELRKLRGMNDELNTVAIEGWQQDLTSLHPDGTLLRPYVVFFGESVPMLDRAIDIVRQADVLIIIGTSLNVYPAASLVNYISSNVPIYIVDPNADKDSNFHNTSLLRNKIRYISKRAAEGVPELVDLEIKRCFDF